MSFQKEKERGGWGSKPGEYSFNRPFWRQTAQHTPEPQPAYVPSPENKPDSDKTIKRREELMAHFSLLRVRGFLPVNDPSFILEKIDIMQLPAEIIDAVDDDSRNWHVILRMWNGRKKAGTLPTR